MSLQWLKFTFLIYISNNPRIVHRFFPARKYIDKLSIKVTGGQNIYRKVVKLISLQSVFFSWYIYRNIYTIKHTNCTTKIISKPIIISYS